VSKKAFAKLLDPGLMTYYNLFMYATRYNVVAMSRLDAFMNLMNKTS